MLAQLKPRIALVVVLFALSAHAQDPAPAVAPPPLIRADLENAMKRIGESNTLDNNAKARIISTYDQALTEIKTAEEYQARSAKLQEERKTAPARAEELRTKVAALAPDTTTYTRKLQDASLEALTAVLSEAKQSQQTAEASLLALRQEDDQRVSRRQQLSDLSAAARAQLEQLRTTPPASQSAAIEDLEADRVYALARAQSLTAEVEFYTEELAGFEARRFIRTLEEDLAKKTLAEAQEKVKAISSIAALNREEQIELAEARALEDAAEAESAPEILRAYIKRVAQQNLEFAQLRAGPESPNAGAEAARSKTAEVQAKYNEIYSQWKSVYQRERAGGLTSAVGKLLRRDRATLPRRQEYLTSIKLRENLIGEAQVEQIGLQEARSADLDDVIDNLAPNPVLDAADAAQLRKLLLPLLTARREILDAIILEYEEYIGELFRLNEEERELVAQRDTFSQYINQRVLWVSSGDTLSKRDFRYAADAALWLVNWRNWKDVAAAALRDIQNNLLLESFALLIFAGGALGRRWQIRRIRQLADLAEKRVATNYWWTLETFLHTVLIGGYLSLVLLYIASRLNADLTSSEFKDLLTKALVVLAAILASVEIPRQMFRPRGLGEVHFGWEPEATASSRRALSWAIPAAFPLLLLIAMIESQDSGEWRESAGRLAFIVLMFVWAVLGHRLTNRKAPSVMIYFPLNIPGERSRIQRVLYLLAAGAPVGLAIAASLGYFDTALRIALRIHATLVFSFVVSIGVGLAMRALLVARRRLAIEQAKKKRAELREAQKKAGDGTDPAATESLPPDIDLDAIDTQTTRLTRSVAVVALCLGVWFIWSDFFPALRVLDEITIGDTTAIGKGFIPGATGQLGNAAPGAPATPESGSAGAPVQNTIPSPKDVVSGVESLTYADVLLAIVIIALTVSASRNLPGLLEIAVLQRLSLSPGERYAIKTVLGYVFALVGAWLAFETLGLPWMKLQWLVAGLGLGIGFGLQEIFANFVSGLIILFEQPVRVGDTVTVGDINGTVTRIRIRATTILDGELKELIVPNKEFVTGKLVNWSLSDTTLRTTIPVCVAYGTDTRRVREILNKVAFANPRVLRDPPPQVALTRFGDNGLVFETRVYVANNEQLSACRDELHDAINDAFGQAGIDMPLPQQDIHIRSAPASQPPAG